MGDNTFDFINEVIIYGYNMAIKLYTEEHPNSKIPHLVMSNSELNILAKKISECNLQSPNDLKSVLDANPVESINEIQRKYPDIDEMGLMEFELYRAASTYIFYNAIFSSIEKKYLWVTLSEVMESLDVLTKFHVSKKQIKIIRSKIILALKMLALNEEESKRKK